MTDLAPRQPATVGEGLLRYPTQVAGLGSHPGNLRPLVRVFSGIRRRLRGFAALGTAALLVVSLAACGDDADDDLPFDDGATGELGEPATGPPAEPPPLPEPSPPGTGTFALGGSTSAFTVTSCRTEPLPDEPEAAQTLLAITGEGTTASGIEFTIEITRFATGTDVRTFTDAVAYADTARILHGQRIEVAGQVTDLRDEDARSALLTPRADGVAGRGIVGPPGSVAGDQGLIGVAFDATC
jgi:hypothetical protein